MDYATVIERIERARDVPAREDSFRRFQHAWRDSGIRAPRDGRGVWLVAGTNGKGTVAKTLETLLSASGATVGLYTSPHLMDTTERIRSGGRDLTPDEFTATFLRLMPLAEKYSLSHFEILTLMAADIFFTGHERPAVDIAVFEVGVGGRLDPTRVIPHEVSVVTRLGLDHVDLLGPSLEGIAREKFAIVDPGNLCVHAPLAESGTAAVARTLDCHPGVRRIEAAPFGFRVERGPVWVLETPWGESRLGLRGARAAENISLALTALAEMNFDVAAYLPELASLRWPGRMERVALDGRAVYLSGDHNPQGVESLAEILGHFDYENLQLVVGIGKNKDRDEMLARFANLPRARLTLTATPFRGGDFALYGPWRQRAVRAVENPVTALRTVLTDAGARDLVLVSGSLYLVGELRRRMVAGEFGPFTPE